MEASGFEPPNSERAVLQTAAFSHFARPPKDYLIIIPNIVIKCKYIFQKNQKKFIYKKIKRSIMNLFVIYFNCAICFFIRSAEECSFLSSSSFNGSLTTFSTPFLPIIAG